MSSETALPLGKLSGSHAVMVKLNGMGYTDVDRDAMKEIFPIFKRIADQSKLVSDNALKQMMAGIEARADQEAIIREAVTA
jgi:2-isopropylmalate synthase